MPFQIENHGTGYIGDLGDSGRVTMLTTPAHVGQGGGSLGSFAFSARCDRTSKFTIDNYLSVKHLYNDQTSRWLSTFDVYLRNVNTDNEFGSFTGVSMMSALDVQRTVLNDTAGLYQRTFQLPSKVEYEIAGLPYYTGGYWASVDLDNVWVEQPINIYGIAADKNFIYVLAGGGHSGEVVFRLYCDGEFQTVWPVYSDATDLANPNSRSIAVGDGYVVIGQAQADRVKMFDTSGNFIRQFGSSGSADGQFNTVSGVAISEFFNSIFVTDSILCRIQRFNKTGVFQNKWGSPGTFPGNTIYNAPNSIAVDPITEDVFIADMHGRVRATDSFGNYQAQPMGRYDFVNSTSIGEYVKNRAIGIGFDSRGNAYGFQDGNVHMYSRTTNNTTNGWFWGSKRVKSWKVNGGGTYEYAGTVDNEGGHVYYAADKNYVEGHSGTPSSLQAIMNHYIALATPDFPVVYLAMNQPNSYGPYPYIGWEGNIWEALCDLCAVTDNAMAAFDDKLIVFSRADRTIKLPDDTEITPVELDSVATGLSVQIVNHNSRWSDVADVMYSALADDRRVFSVDIEGISYYTVTQNTFPQHVFNPVPGAVASPGVYTVVGDENTPISAADWTNYGGYVTAEPGDQPGTILLKIVGPALPPGGIDGPYRLTDVGGTPTLTVTGSGIIAAPETLRIGTGVSEAVTNNLVAKTIDSPFITSPAEAYTEGGWASYNAGTPHQRVEISIHPSRGPAWYHANGGYGGTFQFSNVAVYHDDSEYLIDSVSFTSGAIVLGGYRHNRLGHSSSVTGEAFPRFEEIWNNVTVAKFEAYWAEYTAQDFTIAPLRNPFGL